MNSCKSSLRSTVSPQTTLSTALLAAALLSLPAAAGTVAGNDFYVNAQNAFHDLVPGDGQCVAGYAGNVPICTLAAAVEEAVALGATSRVHLDWNGAMFTLPSTLQITAGTIAIHGPEAGAPPIIGTGDQGVRAFEVAAGATLVLLRVDLAHTAAYDGGGGAIRSAGELQLQRVRISNSSSIVAGGAIEMASGSIVDSWIHGASCFNQAATGTQYHCPGGAIHIVGGQVEIVRSTISNSAAMSYGGGIAIENANVRIHDSTVASNALTPPGAPAYGGGISVQNSTVEIASSTIADNTLFLDTADPPHFGVGLFVDGSSTVTLANSIVAGNVLLAGAKLSAPQTADDCDGGIDSLGYNLVLGPGAACVLFGGPDVIGVDPGLGVLADHGGPTPTLAPAAGGAVVDAGNPSGCATSFGPLTTDQRGVPRSIDMSGAAVARCDIGAFELDTLFSDGFESGDVGAWSAP